MMKLSLIIVLALCVFTVCPVTSISRWFSSSYQDLQVTFRRYGRCVGDLAPFKDQKHNETEFLARQMRVFLDQTSYDNEQLANLTLLMDAICLRTGEDYALSPAISQHFYSTANKDGKTNRCKALDVAMDSMYGVFRRAALNKSEPLDFSSIVYYTEANKTAYYSLTDLINMAWIKSDTSIEDVCYFTDSVKEYVSEKTKNSKAQDRSQQQHTGVFNTLLDLIDRMLEPLLGLQKRLYSETSSGFQQALSGLSNSLGSLRSGVGKGLKSTRDRITGIFVSSSNSTVAVNKNLTQTQSVGFNSTKATTTTTTTTTTTSKPEVQIV